MLLLASSAAHVAQLSTGLNGLGVVAAALALGFVYLPLFVRLRELVEIGRQRLILRLKPAKASQQPNQQAKREPLPAPASRLP